ncbi:MAG: SdrD B-like domain-containing protein, partial [Pseudomonadota bacterium]
INTGTATVELLVTTGGAGTITNNASVATASSDPLPGNNSASENTDVVVGGTTDIPLTQFTRLAGFLDYTVTGATLRAQSNAVDPCAVSASSAATLSGIPASATIRSAYLYWAGSGSTVDATVSPDGAGVTADRTFTARFALGGDDYDFFGGFEDVTAQVTAKRNGSYTVGGLSVDNGGIYCSASAVVAGWSLTVVYEDSSLSGKTLVLYDGFDITRNGSTNYLLSGIYASAPPEARTSSLLWEGDESLGGTNEQLVFNGTPQSDGFNPVNNVYNSTINSLGDSTTWGVDHDTFDVSSLVAVGDTLATTQVDTGPDLVILNSVLLQVKSNVIVGSVFEDVNYGGGAGRDFVTASAAAPSFAVGRPGATVELYASDGTLLRSTTTDAAGEYGFAGLPDGDYTVRVVNGTVTSSRPGATGSELAVQTFRTDARGAGIVDVTGEVGGADPAGQDGPANGGGSNLSAVTAQSLAPVTITAATAKVGVDFGFNFDTIVNTNDTGQGSLRAFLDNSSALTNANLAQAGLLAGHETSLFMIPSAADPFGRPQDPGFDGGRGVAVITVATALPGITDADTVVDGTTQTANVGDTNAGVFGIGGVVGVDGIALSTVARPEIELRGDPAITGALHVEADRVDVRGLAVLGFGTGISSAAVTVEDDVRDTLVERNIFGAAADSIADPGAGQRLYTGVYSNGGDAATVRNNLIGFVAQTGVYLINDSQSWTIEGNELRDCGVATTNGDCIATLGAALLSVSGNAIIGASSQGLVLQDAT